MVKTAEATMLEQMDAFEAMFLNASETEELLDRAQEEASGHTMPVMTSLPCATVTGSIGC